MLHAFIVLRKELSKAFRFQQHYIHCQKVLSKEKGLRTSKKDEEGNITYRKMKVDADGSIDGLPFISTANAMQLCENENFINKINGNANTLFLKT